MAYEIIKSDGTVVALVEDGTADVTSTSLNLIGKNFAGYGILQNENFVNLLENFSKETAPRQPLIGQLWYDKSAKVMKYRFTANQWKEFASLISNTAPPQNPIIGDQWFNTARQQLNIYNGTDWVQIGPIFSENQGTTGALPDIMRDVEGISHVVIKFYINGVVTAIWNKNDSAFTAIVADRIPGFFTADNPQVVKPGLTFADLGTYSIDEYENINRNIIWGTIENSLKLNGVVGTNYLRTDAGSPVQSVNKSVTFSSNITVVNDIYASQDKRSNIGSFSNKFNVVHANLFVGDFQGLFNGIADRVRTISNHTTDTLPEGETNYYFTAARKDEVQNYNNLNNKPILVSNISINPTTKSVIVEKTDQTLINLGSIVGFTGSAGAGYTGSISTGYTGSAGAGYTGSAGAGGINWSTFDRTTIGSFAFIVAPFAKLVNNVSSGSIVTGYTYAATALPETNLQTLATSAFSTVDNSRIAVLLDGVLDPVTSQKIEERYYWSTMIKGPTIAPGSWKIINPGVAFTDLELINGSTYQRPRNTGISIIVFAVRVA